MKKLDAKILVVLEKDGVSGLTVGSKSIKPGLSFSENDWPYGDKALKSAIENKRCKFVEKAEESKSEKPNGNLKKEYEGLKKSLSKLKVGKDDDQILEIESRMKEIETELS